MGKQGDSFWVLNNRKRETIRVNPPVTNEWGVFRPLPAEIPLARFTREE
ncbi:hypothetical protein IQ218_02265 [Synechocystis salina LEGE 06099]|nr:hypothetical protein [Synechocystis salina]MBE9202505.1 hypothetical protein [Synechocystis salina LEGE 06099]